MRMPAISKMHRLRYKLLFVGSSDEDGLSMAYFICFALECYE